MKRFRYYYRMVTLFVVLITALEAMCFDFEAGGIYYSINADGVTVSVAAPTYSWQYKDAVTIPAEVDYNGVTFTVVAIGEKAFYSCTSLTSVEMPSTVTAIRANAFGRSYNLKSVNIPDGLTTIGEGAFEGDRSLASVSLGSQLSLIGKNAFNGCSGLTSLMVDEDNSVYDSREGCNAVVERATNTLVVGCKNTTIPSTVTAIGERAFALCAAPAALTIPASVNSIGDGAFLYCNGLATLTLSDGVRDIGAQAFSHCTSLTDIIISSSVTHIGEEAFAGCWSLASLMVDEGNPVYDSREGSNTLIETASGRLLLGCKNSFIPQGVITVGRSSFAWSKVTTVNIPEGVTAIEDYAFDHCYYVSELSLPSTLVSIGYSAFNGSCDFTSLRLPDSLVSIGGYGFACCGFEQIDFGHGLRHIGDHAFFSCGLTELALPNSLVSIGDYAFLGCTGLTHINIPASVTHIGCGAFQACENLTRLTVDPASPTFDSRDDCNAVITTATNTLVAGCIASVIPGTVTALDNGAFCECIGLHTINIPPSVKHIGDHTFDYCYDLDTITLPPHLLTIGKCAFAGCESLTYMMIPNTVTSIGDSAFYDCPGLNYITLGTDLTSIGAMAFYGCNFITVSSKSMTPPVIAGEDSFWHYGSFSNATLKVPAPSINKYQNAEYWSLFPRITGFGDVDEDGKVSISDVTFLIDILLRGAATDSQMIAADVNSDFQVSISDVTWLIDLLLNGPRGHAPLSLHISML